MLALTASPIARYAVALVVILGALALIYREGRKNGEASLRAEIAAEQERKLRNATKADDDAMRCAADPKCLRSPDKWIRQD